ncbi:MAG: protoporphyrinogen oxidase [Candidatus Melainabacteria bacterium]
MSTPAVDTLIIGGGICGLVSAYRLHQAGLTVTLLEAEPQAGGVIRSVKKNGFILELGPNTFPSTGEHIMALCRDLDLTPAHTSAAAHKRYIAKRGALHPLPSSPIGALTTPLLSAAAKMRFLLEPWQPHTPDEDTTLAEFIRRRLGGEVLDTLAGPFVSGVYAGNPALMSMQAVFPKLLAMEQAHGSLLKGMLARRQAKPQAAEKTTTTNRHGKKNYALHGFPGGMGELTQALANALPPGACRTGCRVVSLQATNDGYLAELESGEFLHARSVILATPATVTATLLEAIAPIPDLSEIPYAPMTVLHLGVPDDQVLPYHPLDGFGMLIPETEGQPLLGCLWNTSLFEGRAPEGQLLLTCFIGGALHPDRAAMDEATLITQVCDSLRQYFHCPSLTPSMTHLTRWERAIPQYTLGHTKRIAALEAALVGHSTLRVTGNYVDGVSINDCVRQATVTASRIQAALSNPDQKFAKKKMRTESSVLINKGEGEPSKT